MVAARHLPAGEILRELTDLLGCGPTLTDRRDVHMGQTQEWPPSAVQPSVHKQ